MGHCVSKWVKVYLLAVLVLIDSFKGYSSVVYSFLGDSQLNLDSKHRLAFPSKYRGRVKDSCGGQMVLIPSLPTLDGGVMEFDKSLWLYPMDKFQPLVEKISKLPQTSKDVRGLRQRVLGGAEEVQLDAGGRVVIPERLRVHANITKNIRLIADDDKYILWAEEEYQAYQNEGGEIPEKIHDLMAEVLG